MLPAPVPGDSIDDSQSAYYPINEIDNPYRYAGYEYIKEIGIYDLNARYYNPEIARFLSQDPYYNLGNRVIGLYEINVPNAWSIVQANYLYVYCAGNPVVFIDVTGYLIDKDEEVLNELDYEFIVALTYEYNFHKERGDIAEAEAIHRTAVKIRQKPEYSGKYNDGIYIDDYQYTNTDTVANADTMEMSEGYAWLIGGNNQKNDDILDLMSLIDPTRISDFLSIMGDIVKSDEYHQALSVLEGGDIRISIYNHKRSYERHAYYKNRTFIAAEEIYYRTDYTKHYINDGI